VGSAVGKPMHKPKIDFYDPFAIYFYYLYGLNPQHSAALAIQRTARKMFICASVSEIKDSVYYSIDIGQN